MRPTRFVSGLTVASALSLLMSLNTQVLQGQQSDRISSFLEPDEGLTIVGTSPLTGHVTFATSPGRGILLAIPEAASAAERALAFVDGYGGRFGAADRSQVQVQRASGVDAHGFEHVRLQQVHQGVPITAAELTVHLKGSRVIVVNGHLIDDLPSTVSPIVPAAGAMDTARALVEKRERPETAVSAAYGEPRLEIFNRGLLEGRSTRSRLAWFVEVTGVNLREYIWIDAETGVVLLNFSQLAEARFRAIYTASGGPGLPGTLIRIEGDPPTGDPDADLAYNYSGDTYDYYWNNLGRDSYDNVGAPLISTVHFCPAGASCPYANAFWNGTQMVYGDGFSRADDVVAHELTHAVTDRSAQLLYYMQSGALNESYSDIFGETIDLTNGRGNDAPGVRWQLGEDIGTIRNMMTPTLFEQPGKVSDPQFWCDEEDSGGVHGNSGVPNHAYALMVDGGAYNGRTIAGIGLTKAAKIQYRALTTYLTSGSGFADNYLALNQACSDLTGSAGITGADCGQMNQALLAVEMPNRWNCPGATAAPALCPAPGTAPVTTFFDSFEAGSPAWTMTSNNAAANWTLDDGFAKSGRWSVYGTNQFPLADSRMAMNAGVVIPAAGRLIFDHAFDFESGFDGGVLEYSTNNGATWNDASGFIDGGQPYNSTLSGFGNNPIKGRQAFSTTSFGYTATRLNLAPVAGQSVKFRFRTGTDESVAGGGWEVDNVRIYSCVPHVLDGDFDGDSRLDITVYRPGGGLWYVLRSGTNFAGSSVFQWGSATDVPLPGDYDGDRKMDLTVYRPSNGTWYVLKSTTNFTSYAAYQWGVGTDIPAPGDYDGDGKTDPTVYRPSTGYWYVLKSSTNFTAYAAYQWGAGTDVPAPGDYDGDGKIDPTVYRPSTGFWYVLKSSTNFTAYAAYQWGVGTDVPAPGDYDGDGKIDPTVYRPSTGVWYVLKSSTNFASYAAYQWGVSTDLVVPADYDGDGTTDIAVYRPSLGTWYVLKSRLNFTGYITYQWGVNTDVPIYKRP